MQNYIAVRTAFRGQGALILETITVEILEALLDKPRPAAFANDDRAFLAAASGRVPYPGLKINAFS